MRLKYRTNVLYLSVLGLLLGLAPGMLLVAQENPEGQPTCSKLFPIEPKAYLLGRFEPDTTRDFVRLSDDLTGGETAYLRSEAAEALQRMVQAAAAEAGVDLTVISSTRSFCRQQAIWNGKFEGSRLSEDRNLARVYPDSTERCQAILRYSSAPGTSRHHWGTDVDFNRTDPAYWRTGDGLVALGWLERNARAYGYFMAYPPDREHGYNYEPWHWSYGPLARPLLRNYYHQLISDEDLEGFLGAEYVRRLPWQEWYVYSVSEMLK